MSETRGVRLTRQGFIEFIYSETFVNRVTVIELIECLKHEAIHIAQCHWERSEKLIADNKGMVEKSRADISNIAMDCAVNQYLNDKVINQALIHGFEDKNAKCCIPKDYNLPDKKHYEYYYEELIKKAKKVPIESGAPGQGTVMDDHSQNQGDGDDKGDKDGKDGKDKKDEQGKEDKKSQDNRMAHEAMKELVRQAAEETAKMQNGWGSLPNELRDEIEKMVYKKSLIPWDKELRRYIGTRLTTERKPSWAKVSKKLPYIIRGSKRGMKPWIAVAMDTSGSIGPEELQAFQNEIKWQHKAGFANILIIECDADVGQTYNYDGRSFPQPTGGGGTSFVPVYNHLDEHGIRPDVLVYFTDGWGDYPVDDHGINTIWVITGGQENIDSLQGHGNRIPFGRILPMNIEELAEAEKYA